jgi:hypothetical protein
MSFLEGWEAASVLVMSLATKSQLIVKVHVYT